VRRFRMGSTILLKKGRFSAEMLRNLLRYYRVMGRDVDYVLARWEEWTHNPRIVVFLSVLDGEKTGWIVYDPERSMIEEIILKEDWQGKRVEGPIIDGLIEKENLVCASILREDTEKYQWMIEYGFRPTAMFTILDFPFVRMDLSTSVLMKKLRGVPPVRAYGKREKVVIERIPETQTEDEVRRGVKNLVAKLGGVKKYVKPGGTVVIKPNLVSDHGLKDGVYRAGIVTDIRVVRALTELFLPVAGKVVIAEGSSINRSETSGMFRLYGYDSLIDLDPKKVSLVDLNNDEAVEKAVPRGKRMVSRKIPITLEKADAIISVPVMKIHFAAIASLGIKHLQGAVPPLEKYMTHFFGLWQNLVNIHYLVKPALTIVDGLTGQEDFGPVSGVPKKMDLLIGGRNPVAVDAVTMRIMGLDPASSPPVWMAWMQGLGPIEMEKIDLKGPPIDEVASPFREPHIDVTGGKDIAIHAEEACPGCSGYLHFVLSKLRRPDPADPGRLLLDRPFERRVNIYLGPRNERAVNPEETNIFMGMCQQHHEGLGTHMPGCPPHAEVIVNTIFHLFPDIERPQYADKSEEARLGEMLDEILAMKRS
jgi:uncharacterized protein (DUF362 family)